MDDALDCGIFEDGGGGGGGFILGGAAGEVPVDEDDALLWD